MAWRFWHILDASGLDATVNAIRLLDNFQRGKLKLDDLVDALVQNTPAAESDDLVWQKGLINPIDKAYDTITNPLVAALDEEVIAAIIAELQDEIWSEIFKASMEVPSREHEQINKLKQILNTPAHPSTTN